MRLLASIAAGAGAITAVFVAINHWTDYGWPRPAWSSDIEAVTKKVEDVGQLARNVGEFTLRTELWRLQDQIDEVGIQIDETPTDRGLVTDRNKLLRRQGEVKRLIDSLQ